jgi:hypothetical protein
MRQWLKSEHSIYKSERETGSEGGETVELDREAELLQKKAEQRN